MIRRFAWVFAVLAVASAASSQPPLRPRLVVLVAVDQMRADYLDRFGHRFSGGLRWLLDEGTVFTNAHQDHASTDTAAGHATITTGVYPARHGIVGDMFWDRVNRRMVDSVRDRSVGIVGGNLRSGRSAARLARSGIGDWLKAHSPRSKTFGVSVKDRAAVFFAGQRPDAAFWLNRRNGDFITSSYYREALPAWAAAFNALGAGRQYFGTVWNMALPADEYAATRSDASPWEQGGAHTAFPHRLGAPGGQPDLAFFTELISTPFGDQYTIDFATRLIEGEELGKDQAADILFLGLSAADYVGHRYGPYSHEVEDYYLRLDAYLAKFFRHLRASVGEGRYLVVLTADHGVAPIPEPLALEGLDAGRHDTAELVAITNDVLSRAEARGELPTRPEVTVESNGVILDFGDAEPDSAILSQLRSSVASALALHPLVAAAYRYEELLAAELGSESWLAKYARSLHPERGPDVMLRFREHHLVDARSAGTDHGSPYAYDTHVPLVFAGAVIPSARRTEPVRAVDIAPTLAALLGIRPPSDLDGRPLDLD